MTRPAPILDQINLIVADMEATVAFYRRLGLTIPDTEPQWQMEHRSATAPGGIDLDFDSAESAVRWNAGLPATRGGGAAVIGFRVASREDVDAIYADMTGAGYRGQQTPYDAFWGARYAVLEDPDGNMVGIMSPRDPSRRAQPEASA